jgi:hypothetical protein
MASLNELHASARGFLPSDCLTIRAFVAVHMSGSAVIIKGTANRIILQLTDELSLCGQCFAACKSVLRNGRVPVASASGLQPGWNNQSGTICDVCANTPNFQHCERLCT